jgi:hypothetical protein
MAYNCIFLSHKGVDKNVVRQYRDVLVAVGLRPWMDESDLPAGPALVRALNEGMTNSCAAVFFVTPQYVDEGYLRSEIDDALEQKVARGEGFSIITLVIADEHGNRGKVPQPLRKYIWKDISTHLEGVRFILDALPRHLLKMRGYLPLQDLVPPTAKEVALVGQNLSSRLGLDKPRYAKFLEELKALLHRTSLEMFVLLMMTPKALLAIHPKAATHLRTFSLPRLKDLYRDLPSETRIIVAFHPSATLSMLAVDWTQPGKAFALITPKFQTTAGIDDRVTMLLAEGYFDSASLARMLLDAKEKSNEAAEAPLNEGPALLESLLSEANL